MMKKLILLLAAALFVSQARAQILNPVKWSFSSKKTGPQTYELHFTAQIDPGWHIYSPSTPAGGAHPTNVIFEKNSPVQRKGGLKEIGKVQTKYEEVFGVNTKFYNNRLELVQVVVLKAGEKAKVEGQVEFMACNGHQCLSPDEAVFDIRL